MDNDTGLVQKCIQWINRYISIFEEKIWWNICTMGENGQMVSVICGIAQTVTQHYFYLLQSRSKNYETFLQVYWSQSKFQAVWLAHISHVIMFNQSDRLKFRASWKWIYAKNFYKTSFKLCYFILIAQKTKTKWPHSHNTQPWWSSNG